MIPGGCTSLLQTPDVCWIKNFKAVYVELYEYWIRTDGIKSQNCSWKCTTAIEVAVMQVGRDRMGFHGEKPHYQFIQSLWIDN